MNTKATHTDATRLVRWYHEYWAQTWYRNTFLTERPDQIAKTTGPEDEWNNIYDSGCNFVCLATIMNIDPARLASILSEQSYFRADRDLPAKRLTGKTGGLVWDQNAPNHELRSVVLRNVWHPKLARRTTISISFVKSYSTRSYARGRQLVAALHAKGRHIICGPEAHSHLVAGSAGEDFYVWDPDDTERSVEENLDGSVTLERLFAENGEEAIDFWEYKVQIT